MAQVAFVPWDGSAGFLDGTNLNYASAGGYCTAVKPGGRMLDIRPVRSPGEFGAGTKNYAGGTLSYILNVIYVGSSEDDCIARMDSDAMALSSGPFSMQVGSKQYFGCILSANPTAEQPKSVPEHATYRMDASFAVTCLRPGGSA